MTNAQNVSVITDISANIFALLVFLLIVALAAHETSAVPRSAAPVTVDLDKNRAGIDRAPLGSEELIDLFYGRREAATLTRIDLTDRAIDIVSPGDRQRFDSIEEARPRLRQLGTTFNRVPAAVYVFDHHFYRGLSDTLRALNWPWREVSVPQALRNHATDTADQSWSVGFSQLISQQSDLPQFRGELARLLQSSPTGDNVSSGGGAPRTTASQMLAQHGVVGALRRWMHNGINAIAIVCGVAYIVWVERRSRRLAFNH